MKRELPRPKILLWLLLTLTLVISIIMAVPAAASDIHGTKTAIDGPNKYYIGDIIHYEMTVENPSGNTETNNLTDIYDTLPDGSVHWFVQGGVDPPLIQAAGENVTYSLNYTVDEADLGTILHGPNAGRYGVLNYFDAHGDDSQGDPVDVHTGWNSVVLRPAINITKTVDFNGDGVYTDLEYNSAGQNASWNITVCNTGFDPVYNITVSDTNGHNFGAAFNLNVGECKEFIYDLVMNTDTVNTATAQGEDELGNPVGPVQDDAAVEVISPDISIEKTVDFDGDDIYGELETNYSGQTASWNITVCNTGGDPVYNITVTDTNGHSFGPPFDLLNNGDCQTFIYDLVMNADTVNTATAEGEDELGDPVGPVSDDAAVNVIGPAISIAKTVDFDGDGIYGELETNYAGQTASWNITVCNTGDNPVYNITVTDTNGHSFGPPFDLLNNGDCQTFIYDLVMNADTVNTATAQGQDGLGGTVGPVSDPAAVDIFTPTPDIHIEKHTNGQDADYAPGPYISVNNTVTWTYIVTNTGAVNLTGIVVTDNHPGVMPVRISGDDGDNILQTTETWIYQATGVAIAGQYANVGTVVGSYGTDEVTDSDPSHYYNSPAVGWETYPVNKVRVLLPWIALLAAIVAGASLLALRHRRMTL